MDHDQLQDLLIAKNEEVNAWLGMSKTEAIHESIVNSVVVMVPGSVHPDFANLFGASAIMYQAMTSTIQSLDALRDVLAQHDGNKKTTAMIVDGVDNIVKCLLNVQVMAQKGTETIGKTIVKSGEAD